MFVVTTLLLMANLFFSLFYVISLRKKIILSFGQLAEQQLVSWQSNSVLNLFPLSWNYFFKVLQCKHLKRKFEEACLP